MESRAFDQYVSRLHGDASRRRILGGLFGTITAALVGGAAVEAKGNKKRRRRPGSGHGAADDVVAVCHITDEGQGIERLQVRRRALRAHLAHGDFRHIDCCENADCEVGPCFSAQCVYGTCSVTQLPQGTPCDLEGLVGGIGGCTATGLCVPSITAKT